MKCHRDGGEGGAAAQQGRRGEGRGLAEGEAPRRARLMGHLSCDTQQCAADEAVTDRVD